MLYRKHSWSTPTRTGTQGESISRLAQDTTARNPFSPNRMQGASTPLPRPLRSHGRGFWSRHGLTWHPTLADVTELEFTLAVTGRGVTFRSTDTATVTVRAGLHL